MALFKEANAYASDLQLSSLLRMICNKAAADMENLKEVDCNFTDDKDSSPIFRP